MPAILPRLFALTLLVVAAASAPRAQVCEGSVTLRTQAEVEAFACTEIQGSLSISGGAVDLAPLLGLTTIEGGLFLDQDGDLTTLVGLDSLRTIGEALRIYKHPRLENVDGLERVESIGGEVRIRENARLTGLSGLSALAQIGRNLMIWDNDALTDLDGLGALESVGGEVMIVLNDMLTTLDGLGPIRVIPGYLQIGDNPKLTSIHALSAVESVQGLVIGGNTSLSSLAPLRSLAHVGGDLVIDRNPLLATLDGVEGIATVPGNLVIGDLAALTDLAALRGISSVGSLFVVNNDALTTLDGIAGLRDIEFRLSIKRNDALASCSCGLAGLSEDGPFAAVGGDIEIEENAPGGACTSPEAVLADPTTCPATSTESDVPTTLRLTVHPNPTASVAQATYSLPTTTNARVTVYDALGRRVAVLADRPHTAGEHHVSLGTLAPGIYLVRVVTEAGARTAAVTVAR